MRVAVSSGMAESWITLERPASRMMELSRNHAVESGGERALHRAQTDSAPLEQFAKETHT